MTQATVRQNLVHDDPAIRLAALETLEVQAASHVVSRAAAFLITDNDAGVRDHAAHLLTRLGDREAAVRIARLIASDNITLRNLAGEVLTTMGPFAIDALEPYIEDPNPDVRKFALDVLALLPAGALAPRIAPLLTDADANVRIAAVDALGAFHATGYADGLRALFQRDPAARPSVIAAFGSFGAEGDLAFLAKALTDEDPVVQLAAAEALAVQDAPAALPILLRKVDAVVPMAKPVVLKAIVDLWEAHPERNDTLPATLKPALLDMLDDPDADYRRAAAAGLRPFLDDDTVDALLAHAGQEDTYDLTLLNTLTHYPTAFVRIAMAADEGRLPTETAAHFVLGLLAGGTLPRALWTAAAHFFTAHFDGYSVETKLATLSYGNMLAPHAFVALFRLGVNDEDPTVADLAEECLADLGGDA